MGWHLQPRWAWAYLRARAAVSSQGRADGRGPERAVLPRETRLATYPVAAVPADRAIPAQPAQPQFQLLRVHEVLDHAERAAIVQPPLDDLIPARHVGLFPTFIDVLIDEQHPPVP